MKRIFDVVVIGALMALAGGCLAPTDVDPEPDTSAPRTPRVRGSDEQARPTEWDLMPHLEPARAPRLE